METFELLGETLRRLRRERDLTLEQVGERAGLGRGQLSRIENSKQEATLSTLAKILNENKAKRGLISVCTAGGMGVTAILER